MFISSMASLTTLTNMVRVHSLLLKPSDKGGNTVVMDYSDYQQMCLRLLDDPACYEILTSDPTNEYKSILTQILKSQTETDGLINTNEFDFLLPKCPHIATFYSLPKVHKAC